MLSQAVIKLSKMNPPLNKPIYSSQTILDSTDLIQFAKSSVNTLQHTLRMVIGFHLLPSALLDPFEMSLISPVFTCSNMMHVHNPSEDIFRQSFLIIGQCFSMLQILKFYCRYHKISKAAIIALISHNIFEITIFSRYFPMKFFFEFADIFQYFLQYCRKAIFQTLSNIFANTIFAKLMFFTNSQDHPF